MTESTKFDQMDVSISELANDMRILSYTGFNEKYRPMDSNTCKWIKLNFKGSSAVVERDNGKRTIPVAEVSPGDVLCLIDKLPSSLINICQVNGKLVAELKERGFLSFIVQKVTKSSNLQQQDLSKAIDRANLFVRKVQESIQICKQATEVVEDLVDSTRQGKIELKEIENQVDRITSSQSSEAIAAIISLKENDQVYAHCIDVAVVYQMAYSKIVQMNGLKSAFKNEKELMLGAFLHDIGNAKLPKDILDNTAPFGKNSKEMQLIRTHPKAGAELLASIGMPDYICDMAHYHHVKFDHTISSSYPEGVEYKNIAFETKLLALVDAFQALTAGRSYKKSWTPPAVMRYLDATAGVEFDLNLWQDFKKAMGHYPRGSFVKLSDGTYGFVISVPKKDVLRPQVVITRNADHEDLKNHYLIDLQNEQDISIAQEIDVKEIYGNNALEVFATMSIR